MLADIYEKLEGTSARLKKISLISYFIEQCNTNELEKLILLLQGRVFPRWSDKEIGVASKMIIKIISMTTGFSEGAVMRHFSKVGDLGLVTEEFVSKKKQLTLLQKNLTLEMVFDNLRRLASVEGHGAQDRKMSIIKELLMFAKPKEAKYIVRTVLEELRIGVAEGVIRDAIAKAFFASVAGKCL